LSIALPERLDAGSDGDGPRRRRSVDCGDREKTGWEDPRPAKDDNSDATSAKVAAHGQHCRDVTARGNPCGNGRYSAVNGQLRPEGNGVFKNDGPWNTFNSPRIDGTATLRHVCQFPKRQGTKQSDCRAKARRNEKACGIEYRTCAKHSSITVAGKLTRSIY